MITLTFVEGDKDLYFFYYVLLNIKQSTQVKLRECKQTSLTYNFFESAQMREMIQRKLNYILLIHNNNKKNAIGAFIESINDFIKYTNPVERISLIVDRDTDGDLEEKIMGKIRELNKNFKVRPIQIGDVQKRDQLYEVEITLNSKTIHVKFLFIEPSLEVFLAHFLRTYTDLPNEQKKGNEDQVIKNAKEYWKLNDTREFCHYISTTFQEKLESELSRLNLKQSICNMF